MYVAQPALSQAIARLEHELGVQLLERTSRHVELTAAGRVFLDGARSTLEAADRAVDAARQAEHRLVGTLSIGYSPLVRYEVVPEVFRAFSTRYPEVELSSREMFSGLLVDALVGGEVEVAFAAYPPPLAGVRDAPIVRDRLVVLAPESGALAGRSSVRLEELAGERFLLWRSPISPGLKAHTLALCRGAGFEPDFVEHAPEANADGHLVRDGVGIALAPAGVHRFGFEGTILVPLEDADATYEGAVVWRDDASAAALRFVEVARATADEAGWLSAPAPAPLAS